MCGKLFLKKMLLVMSMSMLVSCATTKTTDENSEEQRQIKTAKINCQLGLAYLEMRNIQRSKQKLLLALKQAPNIPEPWYSMGYYLESTGDKEGAGTYYRKAIEIAPERGDAHNNYGTYLCRLGKTDESIQHFLTATKDPNYLDVAGAYENAGLCAMKTSKRTRQAKHFFTQALNQDPTRQTSLYQLAEVNYRLGEIKAAKTHLKQFVEIAPKTYEVFLLSSKLMTKLTEQPKSITPSTISLDPAVKPRFIAEDHAKPAIKYSEVKLAEKIKPAAKHPEAKLAEHTKPSTKPTGAKLVERAKPAAKNNLSTILAEHKKSVNKNKFTEFAKSVSKPQMTKLSEHAKVVATKHPIIKVSEHTKMIVKHPMTKYAEHAKHAPTHLT